MFDPMWEAVHRGMDWSRHADAHLIELFPPYLKALDLGCGTGGNAALLLHKGYEVWAVDGSKTAIEKTLQHLPNNKKLHTIVSDFIDLEFEKHTLDLVISISGIDCVSLEEAMELTKKVAVWLKPGGRFFLKMLTDPTDDNLVRVSTRMTGQNELSVLFSEFKTEVYKSTIMIEGLKASHWIVTATPRGEEHGGDG